jgi:anti-sigma B factor antagonist
MAKSQPCRFEIDPREARSGYTLLRVKGEVDLAVARKFQAAIAQARTDSHLVVVDLSACEFIDSTAIAVMVGAHAELADEGRRLVVCAPRDQVLRVLEITGLTSNGLVVESLEEALS